MSLKIVTANRLHDGRVVFLKENGEWSEHAADSCPAADDDAADALLALAERPEQKRAVVGPYLIDAALQDGILQPTRYRERLRTTGPSVETSSAAAPATR